MCFGVELPLECEEQGPSPLFIDFQLCPFNWLHDWKESCLWRHVLFPGGGCDVTHVCDGLPKKKKKKKRFLRLRFITDFIMYLSRNPYISRTLDMEASFTPFPKRNPISSRGLN